MHLWEPQSLQKRLRMRAVAVPTSFVSCKWNIFPPVTRMFKWVPFFAQWSKFMLCTGLPTHIPNENRNVNFPTLFHPNKDKAKHLRISGAILFQQIAKPDKIQVEPPPYLSANLRLVMTLAHHHSMRWGLTPNKIPTNGQNWQ